MIDGGDGVIHTCTLGVSCIGLCSRIFYTILELRSRVFCTILGLCSRVFYIIFMPQNILYNPRIALLLLITCLGNVKVVH